ncbi:hypothetical protein [Nocardioides pacificus]
MRSTLDKLISWTGVLLAVVLIAAGGLLTWANVFIGDQVHDQLAMQDITMPEKEALETEEQHEALDQYAGQQLTTGDQARAFADHYILVHMNASSDGRTYEEVSGEFMALKANPDADPAQVEELGALRQSLFMGNTLRGLLLYGFAFATMGTIAGYAAIAAFVGGAALLILAGLGMWHAKKVKNADLPPARRAAPAGV